MDRSTLTLSEFSKAIIPTVKAVSKDDTILKGVVVGNEAADADSIVCALTLAYKLSINECEGNEVYIPLVACTKEEGPLRQETVILLDKAGVKIEDLVFRDNEYRSMLFEKAGEVVLVDHAKADSFSREGNDKVRRIVDHHKDINGHLDVKGYYRDFLHGYKDKEGDLMLVGSCSTNVAKLFLEELNGIDLLSRDNGAVAKVLYSVILIDTVNLDPKVGKTTFIDIAMKNLTMFFSKNLPLKDEWFKKLEDAKTDIDFWRSTSADLILSYDFKSFSTSNRKLTVGIASIPLSVEDFVKKDGWLEALAQKNKNGGYYILMVLTNVRSDGGTKRQQLFFSEEAGRVEDASDFVRNKNDPSYDLTGPLKIPCDPVSVIAYDQGNVSLSRKKVAPTMMKYLESKLQE